MAKCPKCKAEIDHLDMFTPVEERAHFKLDKDGDPQRILEDGVVPDSAEDDFECPECQELLTHDWDEATIILKGGV